MKKESNLLIGLVLLCLILIVAVPAISIEIEVKDEFSSEEKIFFDYTIFRDAGEEITYSAGVECEFMNITEFMIDENKSTQSIIGRWSAFLEGDIRSQACKSYVEVAGKEREEKEFFINGENIFLFSLIVNKKEVVVGGLVSVRYSCDVEVYVNTTLIYPNGTKKNISLPALIRAGQTGTYIIVSKAEKKGYPSVERREEFRAIENESETPLDIDGLGSGEEGSAKEISGVNDSELDESGLEAKSGKGFLYFIFSIIGAVLVLIIVEIVFQMRRD